MFIHELGHALTALACYVQANPIITVGWESGKTGLDLTHGITCFGKLLGKETADIFIAGAGLLSGGIFALSEFSLAHQIHDRYPQISELLNYHGFSHLVITGSYAILNYLQSVNSVTDPTNDFATLQKLGNIHPALTLALCAGIPLCTYLGYKYLEHQKDNISTDSQALR